jgi:uncharacterized protein (DUF2141 family)
MLAFAGAFSFVSAAAADPPREPRAAVSVKVGPLRSSRGAIACRLHQSSAGFPRNSAGTTTQRVKVAGTFAACTFQGLAPGTYAVVLHHDENDNRKFDTNVLGVPLEGYGVSNNRTHALSAPRWDEAKFTVVAGQTRALEIAIRY